MPEYIQEDQSPAITIRVHFRSLTDLAAFEKLVGQQINGYKVIWFPKAERRVFADKLYVDE